MHSTYFKNFMLNAGTSIFSFLVLAMLISIISRNVLMVERRESLEANATEISRSAIAFAEDGDLASWELRMHITTLANSSSEHVLIANADGLIVSCSDRELHCEHIGYELTDSAMELIRNSDYNNITNLDGLLSTMCYVVAEPIIADEEIWGYTIISYDSTRIFDAYTGFFTIFLLVSAGVFMVALVISMITTRRQTKPINAMAAAATKFAHGDFSVRIEDTGRTDEIGALTASFNLMAESLEKSEERRREFIANVSHELKTPMTTISGFADGILDGTIPPEREKPYLETISSETKRLNRMVRGMLELSKIQADDTTTLQRKSFDISEVLIRTLLSLEGKINDKQLDVEANLPEDHFIVRGDGDAITQVVYNLMDNAIKFSSVGGVLYLSLWKQADKAYVSVKNIGETIPEPQLDLIFDRFHKIDRSRSQDRDGVGLGLYIVKTILGNHGEDISVTSNEGVTEFVFTLTPVK